MLSTLWFSLVVGALSFLTPDGYYLGTAEAYGVVRVCQNKHCCKRANTDVLQTIHNLVGTGSDGGSVVVEASGCLSHCDEGPNAEIQTRDGTTVLRGMTDAQTCALRLAEVSSSSSPPFPPVPKILIAASKVMEQSQGFGAMGRHDEEIRYLASVIAKLEDSPSISPSTPANAHAHALRARAYLQLAEQQQQQQRQATASACAGSGDKESRSESIAASIRDARRVVSDFSAVATPASLSLAYRTWADALLEQQRDEERETREAKDFGKVVAVLTQWCRAQPVYRTKLQGEIRGLLTGTP